MKDTLILIGGGSTFKDVSHMRAYYKDYDPFIERGARFWHEWLLWSLDGMYNTMKYKTVGGDNADYEVWKVIFEKHIQHIQKLGLSNRVHLVAHSLGALFIVKYLLECVPDFHLVSLHLVAPLVTQEFQADEHEHAGTFAYDHTQVGDLAKLGALIHVWHSRDDTICSFANTEYLMQEIPTAMLHEFADRGHFISTTFVELFDELRT